MINANALHLPYPDGSAHMAATSPPYYQKRRYAGVEPCAWPAVTYRPMPGLPPVEIPAVGVDCDPPERGILGLEPDPLAFIGHLVLIFREAGRVLRDDGVLCVNIGDSYTGSKRSGGKGTSTLSLTAEERAAGIKGTSQHGKQEADAVAGGEGYKPKDLMGIPWRLAFALIADGWTLRSRMPGGVDADLVPEGVELRPDVIWRKNAMPESVRDRPSVDFEDVFIFSKGPRYFWDQENGRTNHAPESLARQQRSRVNSVYPGDHTLVENMEKCCHPSGANMRASWKVTTEPTREEHYAAWPRELVRRLIKVGTSDKGCCPECGAQWVRQVERISTGKSYATGKSAAKREAGLATAFSGYDDGSPCPVFKTTGWDPTCSCDAGDPIPCRVLDPFSGIGRTGEVCYETGRTYLPAELSTAYANIQKHRLANHVAVARDIQPKQRPRTITGPLFST